MQVISYQESLTYGQKVVLLLYLFLLLKRFILFSCLGMFNFSTKVWSRCFQIKKDKQMLLPSTNGDFQLSTATECCVTTRYIPFHDFYPPTASYLCSRNSRFLGCLLSLLGFFRSPVNSQKNSNSYPCLLFTVSLSQHCKNSLR